MIYIESEENKKILSRILSKVVLENEKITIPYSVNQKQIRGNFGKNRIEKIAIKITKKVSQCYCKNVILENKLKKNKCLLNSLYSKNVNIVNGKIVYQVLLAKIVEYITLKNNMDIAEQTISFCINKSNRHIEEVIKKIATKCKRINIVTNNRDKFKSFEEEVVNTTGTILNVSNNRKKALLKSSIVINFDFPSELLNKYNINNEAFIINVTYSNIELKKRYGGIMIDGYNMKGDSINCKYDKKDELEAMLIENKITKEALEKQTDILNLCRSGEVVY